MTPRFLGVANIDALDLVDFFNAGSPGTGAKFATELADLVRVLVIQPRRFARIPRPPRGREIRTGRTARFPVVVVYEVTRTEVVIVSVVHARSVRNPWRRRLGPP